MDYVVITGLRPRIAELPATLHRMGAVSFLRMGDDKYGDRCIWTTAIRSDQAETVKESVLRVPSIYAVGDARLIVQRDPYGVRDLDVNYAFGLDHLVDVYTHANISGRMDRDEVFLVRALQVFAVALACEFYNKSGIGDELREALGCIMPEIVRELDAEIRPLRAFAKDLIEVALGVARASRDTLDGVDEATKIFVVSGIATILLRAKPPFRHGQSLYDTNQRWQRLKLSVSLVARELDDVSVRRKLTLGFVKALLLGRAGISGAMRVDVHVMRAGAQCTECECVVPPLELQMGQAGWRDDCLLCGKCAVFDPKAGYPTERELLLEQAIENVIRKDYIQQLEQKVTTMEKVISRRKKQGARDEKQGSDGAPRDELKQQTTPRKNGRDDLEKQVLCTELALVEEERARQRTAIRCCLDMELGP